MYNLEFYKTLNDIRTTKLPINNENIKRLISLKDFAFSGGADYVVASAQNLYSEATEAVGSDKTILVQNGVDTRHYRDPRHNAQVLPASLAEFRRKFKYSFHNSNGSKRSGRENGGKAKY